MSIEVELWKLTDRHDCTYVKTRWGKGVTHTAPGTGDLCTAGWIFEREILTVSTRP